MCTIQYGINGTHTMFILGFHTALTSVHEAVEDVNGVSSQEHANTT